MLFAVFYSGNVLTEHKENCLIINGRQSIKLGKGSTSFKNYSKQLPVPYKIYADFECILCPTSSKKVSDKNGSYTEKHQDHIPCSFAYKVACVDNKLFVLIMFAEEEERFQLENSYLICNKLFDVADEKVQDHCHVTGKFRGAVHFSCNANCKLSKKVPVIFHNLRGYDSHLIIKEISKFDVKVSVIPNGLEKYMAFTVNKNLAFIDSMQFMNSGLDSLVKSLSNNDFKYLSKKFSGKFLELVKEKLVYPYEYMNSFKKFF